MSRSPAKSGSLVRMPRNTNVALTHLDVAAIRVGRRHRRDFGDIEALAQDINDIGLMHPVVVRPDNRLIAGARRLKAVKKLGWDRVPVRVINLDRIERGEYAENILRKEFTPSEYVAIADAIEPAERGAAKKRQGTRTDKHPEKFSGSGNALDKVSRAVGISRPTLAKAREVVEAAKAEPEKYGALVTDMDRTGRVNSSFKRLRVLRQEEAIRREPPPLPNGLFRVIVADPPWPYEKGRPDPRGHAGGNYPEMSIEQICALDVAWLAAPDSILWLWTTNYHMRNAFAVLDAWGFEHRSILTWAKNKIGTGYLLRGQTEHCLVAIRGKPIITLINQTTLLQAPMRGHSQKPEEFYALVEKLCPAPRDGYAELFARTVRPNWVGHGNELPKREAAERPAHPPCAA